MKKILGIIILGLALLVGCTPTVDSTTATDDGYLVYHGEAQEFARQFNENYNISQVAVTSYDLSVHKYYFSDVQPRLEVTNQILDRILGDNSYSEEYKLEMTKLWMLAAVELCQDNYEASLSVLSEFASKVR